MTRSSRDYGSAPPLAAEGTISDRKKKLFDEVSYEGAVIFGFLISGIRSLALNY